MTGRRFLAAWLYAEVVAILQAVADGTYYAEPSITEGNLYSLHYADPAAWD